MTIAVVNVDYYILQVIPHRFNKYTITLLT